MFTITLKVFGPDELAELQAALDSAYEREAALEKRSAGITESRAAGTRAAHLDYLRGRLADEVACIPDVPIRCRAGHEHADARAAIDCNRRSAELVTDEGRLTLQGAEHLIGGGAA